MVGPELYRYVAKGNKSVALLVLSRYAKDGIETSRKKGFPRLAKTRAIGDPGGRAVQKDQKLARLDAIFELFEVRQLLVKPKDRLTDKDRLQEIT